MSKESMEIDFQKSKEAAKALKELAGFLEQAAENDLLETLMSIRGNWEGETAGIFLKGGSVLYQKIKKSAARLASGAQAVEQAAKNIYDVEQQAIIMARERKY